MDITRPGVRWQVLEDDSPVNCIGQHAFKHVSRQYCDVIRTSLLDAVAHDLTAGTFEFFAFQLPDAGIVAVLDNASDVA